MFLGTLEGLYPSLPEEPGMPGGGGDGVGHARGVPRLQQVTTDHLSRAVPSQRAGAGRGAEGPSFMPQSERPLWTQQWFVD